MSIKLELSKPRSQSKNHKNNNSNIIKKPIYVMSIELDEGKKQDLKIYDNSKPDEIAYEFCKNNNLDFSSLQFLINQIENLMKLFKKNNSSLNKNNNINNRIVPEVIREESNEETLRSMFQNKEKSKIVENGNDLCGNKNNQLNLKINKKNSILSYDRFFTEMKEYLINKNKKLNQEKPKSPNTFKSKIINKKIINKTKNKSQNKFIIQHNNNDILKIKKQKQYKKNISENHLSQSLLLKNKSKSSSFLNRSRNQTINQSFHKRNISFNRTNKNNSIKNYNQKINQNRINKKIDIKKVIKTSKDNRSKNKINSNPMLMDIKGNTYDNFYKNKENGIVKKFNNEVKHKLFLKIFRELNRNISEDNEIEIDKNNFINLKSMNVNSLNGEIRQILMPMLNELINSCSTPNDNENNNYNYIISKLRFIDYGVTFSDKLSKEEKQTLINYLDI